jgi:hypothetical protein
VNESLLLVTVLSTFGDPVGTWELNTAILLLLVNRIGFQKPIRWNGSWPFCRKWQLAQEEPQVYDLAQGRSLGPIPNNIQ